jgi:WD40 repeat protein
MAELYRYAAFISYSSNDAPFARRLHRALESYGIPSALGKFDLLGEGGKRNRVYPVFRDREELPAGDLGDRLEASLKASGALIVVCSRHAAASPWVQKEIEFFAGLGRRDRVFAIIPDTAPLSNESGGDITKSFFPPALRGDALAGTDAQEPLAADARKSKDGFRHAWLKVVAGLIGVTPGQLIDRDRRPRREQFLTTAAASAVLVAGGLGAAAWVDTQTWRSRLSTYAESLTSEGRPLAALPFAIAGAGSSGEFIAARSDWADAVLASIAGAKVRTDLGAIGEFSLSRDGSVLFVMNENNTGAVYHLRRGMAKTEIGPVAGFTLSDDGSVLVVFSIGKRATAYDLVHGTKINFGLVGTVNGLALAPNGASLFASGYTYDSALYVLKPAFKTMPLGKLQRSASSSDFGDIFRAARSGPKPQFDISDNGAALVIRGPNKDMRYYDLTHPSDGKSLGGSGTLAADQGFQLYPNGSVLLTKQQTGESNLFDLAQGGAKIPLGRVESSSYIASSNDGGIVVAYSGANKPGRLIDVKRGRQKALPTLPAETDFALAVDGSALLFRDSTGSATYVDLAHGDREYALGKIGSAAMSVSTNGATLVVPQFNGDFAAYDLTKGGAAAHLPSGLAETQFHLSSDGSALGVVRKNGTGVVLPLRGRRKTPMELGDVHQTGLTLSDTGSAVIAGDQHTPFTLFDLVHGARRTAVGRLAAKTGLGADTAYAFTSDGSLLVARDEDGTGAVYDLSSRSPAVNARGDDLAGKSLVESVCLASGPATRSFPANAREIRLGARGREQSNAIARSLIGRPWNPCDWRGLEAGAEGWAQWWRLVRIRYLGAPDYACAEIDAAGHMSAARRSMCAPAVGARTPEE